MDSELRRAGLPVVGDVPWGTHLCQFYRSKDDLLESLVPYFEAGLASGERCLWITSDPLRAAEAEAALRRVVPGFEALRESGQIEILDHEDWCLHQGATDADATVSAWLEREQDALRRGFSGLRLTGDTSWLEPSQWGNFAAYESKAHRAFHGRRILALCSYSLAKCGPHEIVDVIRHHRLALIRRNHGWELAQNATSALAALANERCLNGPGADAEPRSGRRVPSGAHSVQFYDRESTRREAEREARADAEAVTRHLVLVQEVTSALSEAATPADVARVVVTTMASALGAGSAILAIPSADGERLTLLGHNGLLASTSETHAEFSVTAPLPAATAFRTGEQVWLPTLEAIAEQYPHVAAFTSTKAIVCVPVTLSGRRLGALGFGFFSPRRFTATERAMVDDLARQVTLALDRAGLYAEAQRSRDRLDLLAADSIAPSRTSRIANAGSRTLTTGDAPPSARSSGSTR